MWAWLIAALLSASPPRASAAAAGASSEDRELDVAVDEIRSYAVHVRSSSSTAAEVELGRRLFFDPRLSRNGAMSCASCHQPSLYWTDGLVRARGLGQEQLPRNTPSLLTAGYYRRLDWDGNADDNAQAALIAVKNPKEMAEDPALLAVKLKGIAEYAAQFASVYGRPGVTAEDVGRALGAFVATLQAPEDSAFDRFVKDRSALNASERRGLLLYSGRAGCRNCHSSMTFTDNRFRRIGLKGSAADVGRYALDPKPENWQAFRTPTLRNVALTGPYMHDGSLKTLRDVIDFYDRGGDAGARRDADMPSKLDLTPQEKDDLAAFLRALTSSVKPVEVPFLPAD